jgi:hypothetical protein
VSGVTLGEWINQDHNNGVLDKISESVFVWVVQAENLSAINEKLGKLGLLLAWKSTAAKASAKKYLNSLFLCRADGEGFYFTGLKPFS